MKPFEAKMRKVSKELEEVSAEVASLIDMAKRPEMKDLSSDFMEEANSLGKRKGDLQIEKQKLQMEIDYRRNLVTDETIICEKLTDFTSLFDELSFEEQRELIGLILKEIRVSRFDPEKDKHPCKGEVFVTQMRTSWYRIEFRLFSNSLSIREMLGKSEKVPPVRNTTKSGGERGMKLRTLTTLPCIVGVVRDTWTNQAYSVYPIQQACPVPQSRASLMKVCPKDKHIIHLSQNWSQALKSGRFGSSSEISQVCGLSTGRVRQIIRLSGMHPKIVTFLMSLRGEKASKGFSEAWIRSILPLSHMEQIECFERKFNVHLPS